MNPNKPISQDLVDSMIRDPKVRIAITTQSHWYFFHFYFADYIKYATADFQKEMISLTENDSVKNIFIVAFRSSGKSTLMTMSYPIWAILGRQQKKFILILCRTQSQAKQHMMNLRNQLESNELLKNDLGPFQEETDEWGSSSLVFANYNARVTVASVEQSIRGLRHNQHRPDVIICDDIEDITSTRTREGRQKTHDWLHSEVIPAGDKNSRLIVVGNLLHEDSLLMRIAEDIENGVLNGEYRRYPLLDDGDRILWPGKYPTLVEIETEKKRIGNEIAWQREYLLRIVPDDDQVIDPAWIQFYNELPPQTHEAYRGIYAAADLAISKKDSADCTAIVSAMIFGRAEKLRIYILPNPIIKKLSFPEQVDLLRTYSNAVLTGDHDKLFVENNAYQDALPQMLETVGVKAKGVNSRLEKRTRLAFTAPVIRAGRIKFPRKGAEEIINQIKGFGIERHDDAADAFSMLILKISELHFKEPTAIIHFLNYSPGYNKTIYCSDYIDVEEEVKEEDPKIKLQKRLEEKEKRKLERINERQLRRNLPPLDKLPSF